VHWGCLSSQWTSGVGLGLGLGIGLGPGNTLFLSSLFFSFFFLFFFYPSLYFRPEQGPYSGPEFISALNKEIMCLYRPFIFVTDGVLYVRMAKGVKQLVLSVCQSGEKLNIDRVKRFPKLTVA